MTEHRFYSRLTGKLLGDGCIIQQPGRRPRFQFMHRTEDLGWSTYCYEQLKDFLPLNPPTYKKVIDPRTAAGFTECFVAQSRTDEKITLLESLWYENRKKQLPLNFIKEHLNEEALAWWYQDDGHLKIADSVPKKIILSTDSFSDEERSALQTILYQKFALQFKSDNQCRLILYDQPQIYYFLKIVEPYIHPCMNRKSFMAPITTPIIKPKRTTVYLPDHIVLPKPTMDINDMLQSAPMILSELQQRSTIITFYQQSLPLLKKNTPQKSYQIVLTPESQTLLHQIRQCSGWTYSQIAHLCYAKTTNLFTAIL